ncbi:DUF1330 domain-containing protein [Paraburkholderia sp. Ac-20340]|uniref:DUF1330 domain-containing protein n=1 Tax=Paraburkholderia sp. Ac-20340 TaxID=2703888 RepID=UPI00197D0C16|nr:DUF1330 domain-containing protein [Paraburkholderia sp. Ac-20340]MBN3858588.1 DUF1330 domain-containing protein [Paraburkholderia sp. Ac-20340]
MAKGYWVSVYRRVNDPEKLAAYARLASEAVLAAGGRFIARGVAVRAYDSGAMERTTIVEFDSVEAAIQCREGEKYMRAVEALGDAVERDFRIVEGC